MEKSFGRSTGTKNSTQGFEREKDTSRTLTFEIEEDPQLETPQGPGGTAFITPHSAGNTGKKKRGRRKKADRQNCSSEAHDEHQHQQNATYEPMSAAEIEDTLKGVALRQRITVQWRFEGESTKIETWRGTITRRNANRSCSIRYDEEKSPGAKHFLPPRTENENGCVTEILTIKIEDDGPLNAKDADRIDLTSNDISGPTHWWLKKSVWKLWQRRVLETVRK
jgi:hypothetical protein